MPDADNGLTVRTTSTGVKVIEGDCPHCGHPAQDHWSDGCKGARGGADHCRMDPWKLERIARPIPPGDWRDPDSPMESGEVHRHDVPPEKP